MKKGQLFWHFRHFLWRKQHA